MGATLKLSWLPLLVAIISGSLACSSRAALIIDDFSKGLPQAWSGNFGWTQMFADGFLGGPRHIRFDAPRFPGKAAAAVAPDAGLIRLAFTSGTSGGGGIHVRYGTIIGGQYALNIDLSSPDTSILQVLLQELSPGPMTLTLQLKLETLGGVGSVIRGATSSVTGSSALLSLDLAEFGDAIDLTDIDGMQVSVIGLAPGEAMAMDQIAFVPEPASGAVLGGAAFMVAGRRRRRSA